MTGRAVPGACGVGVVRFRVQALEGRPCSDLGRATTAAWSSRGSAPTWCVDVEQVLGKPGLAVIEVDRACIGLGGHGLAVTGACGVRGVRFRVHDFEGQPCSDLGRLVVGACEVGGCTVWGSGFQRSALQ